MSNYYIEIPENHVNINEEREIKKEQIGDK